MRRSHCRLEIVFGLMLPIWLATSNGFAATRVWTNAASGTWATANHWLSGQLPTAADDVLLTNATSKTVTVDSTTITINLAVSTLTLSAPTSPAGQTNTLTIADLTSGTNFVTSVLTLNRQSVLRVTNSSLRVNSTFDLAAGTFTLDSGLVTATNSTLRAGRLAAATGTLNVNGGTLRVLNLQVGSLNLAFGSLNLAGGLLHAAGNFSVGEINGATGAAYLTGGELSVTNGITKIGNAGWGELHQSGGTASFAFYSIGDNRPGTNNFSGGTLLIQPRTTNDLFRIGNLGDGYFNMSGGTAIIHSEFHLADDNSFGAVGVANLTGGQLYATNDLVAIGRIGTGSMTVSNATAVFTNTSVGRHPGSVGTLTVLANATVTTLDSLSIGRFPGSLGSVHVSGGTLNLPNDTIWVGRGGAGNLTVSNGNLNARTLYVGVAEYPTNTPQGNLTITGGQTTLASNLVVGTSGISSGQVVMTGGGLALGGGGTTRIDNGTFTLDQGTLAAGVLWLTNPAGQFTFNGGTLQAASLLVSNGAPFVVGDGVSPATLVLQCGDFTFADSLVISSNATVTGCGNITGNIVNNGTLDLKVKITGFTYLGPTNTLWFTTLITSNHVLEFRPSLTAGTWQAVPPAILGTGGILSLSHTDATNTSGFYRIRVQ